MTKIQKSLYVSSLVANIVFGSWFVVEKMENTYLRIIVGMIGYDIPAIVNSNTVIKMGREKSQLCSTEVSLVDGYAKMSVNDVIELADDIKKVRGEKVD